MIRGEVEVVRGKREESTKRDKKRGISKRIKEGQTRRSKGKKETSQVDRKSGHKDEKGFETC